MSPRLVYSAIMAGLETGLNSVLALDTAVTKKLDPLSGKTLRVICERPPLVINILISENRILLRQAVDDDTPADTSISGSSAALLRLLIKRKTSSLRDDGITITGNTALLSALQDIFQDLDFDWEYQLSRFIGDIPTQTLSDGLTSAGNFARHMEQSLEQDIDDYLHEEKKLFPAEQELQEFYKAIDALRLRADRLASRTSRLASKST